MSYQMKKYEDLDITDNFMFAKVFSNEDVAKDFLQDVLKISIDKILFICPDDIFGKDKPVYRFQNREESDPSILMGDLCYKNFYIFKKYREIKDNSIREYMQYFATQEHGSAKMKRIHDLVEQYRKDPITKKAYMTLEQELNIRYKKGRDEEKRELAKALRVQGKLTLEEIASVSGLTPEEIKAL